MAPRPKRLLAAALALSLGACAPQEPAQPLATPPPAWAQAWEAFRQGDAAKAKDLAAAMLKLLPPEGQSPGPTPTWQQRWLLLELDSPEGSPGAQAKWEALWVEMKGLQAASGGAQAEAPVTGPYLPPWSGAPSPQAMTEVCLRLGQVATAEGVAEARKGHKAEAKKHYQRALEAYQEAQAWTPGEARAEGGIRGLKATLSFML